MSLGLTPICIATLLVDRCTGKSGLRRVVVTVVGSTAVSITTWLATLLFVALANASVARTLHLIFS